MTTLIHLLVLLGSSPQATAQKPRQAAQRAQDEAPTSRKEAPTARDVSKASLLSPGRLADAKVQRLFDRAVTAFDEGEFVTARDCLREAWSVNREKGYDIAANLGIVFLKLDEPVQAARFLSIALAERPVSTEPEIIAELEARLRDARRLVAGLKVEAAPTWTGMTINGRTYAAPTLTRDEVFAEAGKVQIVAQAPDHVPLHHEFILAPGQRAELVVRLHRRPPPLWPVLAGGGVALAGLALGGGLFLASRGEGTDAERLRDRLLGAEESCVFGAENYASACASLDETARRADTLHNAGVALLVTGGVAAVGTGVWALYRELARRERSAWPAVEISPGVSSGAVTVHVEGAF
ncbi:hypothetical protein [Chondromyces crocatus]|uniref:hypothetical protein n=1 Tax=Chondromyces crocatus TaxID=52 RepID=UPI0012E32A95|nr:hypothetical protein [Chondromyces crocatus]